MKEILVTGASGLCGHSCCKLLLEKGYSVYAIVKSKTTRVVNGVKPVVMDLTDEWNESVMPSKVDVILHLAQSPYFREFPQNAVNLFKVNIESTIRLLDYGHRVGVKKFIFTSSGGVYGNGRQAFNENFPIVPTGELGHYLGSKACSEIMIHNYATFFDVIILRPFFVYGPGQEQSMLIPRLFRSVGRGSPIILQGSSGICLNPVHVNDASRAMVQSCLLEESAVINIAGPEVLSMKAICDTFGDFLGVEPIYESSVEPPSNLIGDIELMKSLLHVPSIRLSDSLEEFVLDKT
jgi:nucleoside-diphosphate-sugar epimerase